ncbi:MAG: hypothetical protein ACXWIO_10390 [Croceibacterium sp.]
MMREAILISALLVTACNPIANMHEGETQIERFHQLYSSGSVDALYAMTGPRFHEATTRKQFQDMFDVLNSRLGRIKSSQREGFRVNTNGSGTVTNVGMKTRFEQGLGFETFTFFGDGDDMKLEGWHVDSNRLTITADDLARERQINGSTPTAKN